MSARRRTLLLAALGIFSSAAGLAIAFWRVRLDGGLRIEARVSWAELAAALGAARRGWLIAFAAANLATLPAHAWQLRALARRRDGGAPPLGACYHAAAVAALAQNILPARLGEAARPIVLVRAGGVAPAEATGAVVLARVLDLAAMVAVTSLPALVFGLPAMARVALVGAAAGAALVGGLVALELGRARAAAWAGRIGPRTARAVAGFAGGLAALRSPARLSAALAASLAAPALSAAAFACALRAFGLEALPPGAALVTTAVVYLAVALPAAPSSLGVYHVAVAWLLTSLGAAPAAAAAFAVATHAVSTLAFAGAGAVSLARVGAPQSRE